MLLNPEIEALSRIVIYQRHGLLLDLSEDDFADPMLRAVFAATKACHDARGEVDPLAIDRAVAGGRADWGGFNWLQAIGALVTPAHTTDEQVLRNLRELRVLRETRQINLTGLKPHEVGPALEKHAAHLRSLLGRKTSALAEYAQEIAAVPAVQPLGFPAMDGVLDGGVEHGAVLVIAARPGLGKTSLATSVAAQLLQAGKSVFFASLEMSRKRIAERVLCAAWGLPVREIRENAEDAAKVPGSLFIEDRVGGIEELLSAFAAHLDSDLFVIDYFQLVTVKSREMRQMQLEHISRAVKLFALQNKKPVLLLSQLNRESAKENREPDLFDLRGSGALEQDADVVTFLHDPDAALDAKTSAGSAESLAGVATTARRLEGRESKDIQWIVRKNRNGPLGLVPLEFHPRLFLFREKR